MSFTPSERLAIGSAGAAAVAALAAGSVQYALAVSIVAVAVARLRGPRPLPDDAARGLALLPIGHVAGGLVPVGRDVLYNAHLWHPALRYDHLFHAAATVVAVLVVRHLLPPGTPVVLAGAAALALGAVNEIVEFAATSVQAGTHVGGYENASWDLVVDLAAAAAATALCASRRSPSPA